MKKSMVLHYFLEIEGSVAPGLQNKPIKSTGAQSLLRNPDITASLLACPIHGRPKRTIFFSL